MTVFPFPAPQGISQIGDTLFANAGAGSYQWYFNNTIINGATDYYYLATQNGNYNVICTDNNGCEVEAVIFDVFVAVDELTPDEFEIYPVPVEGVLTIKTGNLIIDQIILCNAMGEKVLDIRLSSEGKVDLSNFSSGIYFVMLKSEEKIFWKKIIKY
jgi:hypothetical protein